jgi:hypothetical protein
MKPTWKHDCEHCKFLGAILNVKGNILDLYAHPHHGHTTVIARYSNDGPDYLATDLDRVVSGPLAIAAYIYKEMGK